MKEGSTARACFVLYPLLMGNPLESETVNREKGIL